MEVEAEAPIIHLTNLDLSDVLKIRMCSSLLLRDHFLDCNRQWKASGIAKENCDFARSEAWVCPPFPVPVKSSNFFLVAGTAVRNNNRKISKEHEQ